MKTEKLIHVTIATNIFLALNIVLRGYFLPIWFYYFHFLTCELNNKQEIILNHLYSF